jgi:hypothetical protein
MKIRKNVSARPLSAAGALALAISKSVLAWPAAGQSITGTVADEAGQPLAGVWVTARDSALASAPRRTVVSGAGGTYTVPGLDWPGAHRLRARALGYADTWTGAVMSGSAADIAAPVPWLVRLDVPRG